jgi:hypothetical protein
MRKNLFMVLAVILSACMFVSCSKDDDAGVASTLTMNGEGIKIKSIEGEYEPTASFRPFSFWVNDATAANGGVYIQGTLSGKLESLVVGEDITSRLSLLLEYNSGDEYVSEDDYRSGKLVLQALDLSKKVLTLEFSNLKFINNLQKEVVLNGTLTIPYQILE